MKNLWALFKKPKPSTMRFVRVEAAPPAQDTLPDQSSQDSVALKALRDVSSDPDAPHSFRHYLYFPRRKAADQAAEWLHNAGFAVTVQRGADGKNWLALAGATMLPTEENVKSARGQLEQLANELGGEYDGWEAAVQQDREVKSLCRHFRAVPGARVA